MRARVVGFALLAALAAAFAVDVAWIARNVDDLRPLRRGRPAPGFRLPSLDGGTVALDDLRGDVALVSFWASWCEPCVAELPHLDRLATRLRGRGLRVLAVNAEEDADVVRGFVERAGLGLTVLLDGDGAVRARYGVESLPYSLAIGRDGRVRDVAAGPRSEKRLAALVEPLL